MSAAAYSETFDVGRVVVRAFDVIRRNLVILAVLVLVLYGLPKIGGTLVHRITGELPFFHHLYDTTAFFYGLIAFLGYFAFQAAAVHVFAADLNGRAPSLGTSFRLGLNFLLPLLGLGVVACIGVIVGLICLIVPGLFLATIWAVSAPAMVVERLDVGQALGRSSALTQGHRWPVFFIGLVFFLVSGLIHGAFDHSVFGDGENLFAAVGRTVAELFSDAVDVIFALIGAVLVASTYFELRTLKEGAGPEDLAEAVD
jgi:hypothetical protein